jgi:large subunit GTPase 1
VIPLDSLHDYLSPIRRLCDFCPLPFLEMFYGIKLLDENNLRSWGIDIRDTPLSFLYSVSSFRKFFTSNHGVPDISRSSKMILKDYVSGKLIFNIPPPNLSSIYVFNGVDLKSATDDYLFVPLDFSFRN